jgi:WXG100 family type VII secretion target
MADAGTEIKVDYPGMDDCVSALNQAAGSINDDYNKLTAACNDISGTWRGDAQAAYAQIEDDLMTNISTCGDNLTNIAQALEESKQTMQDADNQGANAISQSQ